MIALSISRSYDSFQSIPPPFIRKTLSVFLLSISLLPALPLKAQLYIGNTIFNQFSQNSAGINLGIGAAANASYRLYAVQNTGSGSAIVGENTATANGLFGAGVVGISQITGTTGVFGVNTNGAGVTGFSTSGHGLSGSSINSHGIYGHSQNGFAGYFDGKIRATLLAGEQHTGELRLFANSSLSNGAALYLYGDGHSSHAGGISLNAGMGGGGIRFIRQQATNAWQEMMTLRDDAGTGPRLGIAEPDPEATLHVGGGGEIWANGLYFLGSGKAPDGKPNARLSESWGMRFLTPDGRWQLSTNGALLAGYEPSGGYYKAGDVLASGNVGIGTESPAARLHLLNQDPVAMILDRQSGVASQINFLSGGTPRLSIGSGFADQGQNAFFVFDETNQCKVLSIDRQPSNQYITRVQGRLIIGTQVHSTNDALMVDGSITCKQARVTVQNWYDHVFSPEYQLMPLDSVEAHISRESRLPGMPAAETVLREGLSLGEMQGLLLQKIEELTLYLLELKRENTELREELKELKP